MLAVTEFLCQIYIMKYLRATLPLFSFLLFAPPAAAQVQAQLQGVVSHIRDGDTIKIGPVPVRLEGVSAPELREPLGEAAKTFMRDLVRGKQVLCRLTGHKTFDRFVGVCFRGGKDIGEIIIAKGLALDCPRYSKGRYAAFQTAAAKMIIKLPNYCRKQNTR